MVSPGGAVRPYEATLHVQNPLSFRTNEYGNVVRTSRILHNWALRFALNRVEGDPEKDHRQNLAGQPIYATPAIPLEADYEFQTFHPFPEAPTLLRKGSGLSAGSRKTYQGMYTILQYKEVIRVGSTFRFAIASQRELPRKVIITYGGKRTLQRVTLEPADSISQPEPIQGAITHLINPLDFPERVRLVHAFQYSLPPSPLFEGFVGVPFSGRRIRKGSNEYVVPPSW